MNNSFNIQKVCENINMEWTAETCERALAGMKRKQQRRKQRNVVVTAIAAALLLAVSAFWGGVHMSQQANPSTNNIVTNTADTVRGDKVIVLKDNSQVFPVDDISTLYVEKDTQTDIQVRIAEGGARFEVTSNPNRNFVVRAEDVSVTVHGTIFRMERFASHVIVSVEDGLVEVSWADGKKFLKPGEEDRFPLYGTNLVGIESDTAANSQQAQSVSPDKKRKIGKTDWRHFAHRGEFETASKMITKKEDVRDTVEDLLLAADAMRLSGKPKKGLFYLRKIVKNHSGDPRAVLAEFTRGRILLTQMGSPREAALSFRQVQNMTPKSSLAEDALAREVESWHRSGEQGTARDRAQLYTTRYPQGRRLKAVRQFGGIE